MPGAGKRTTRAHKTRRRTKDRVLQARIPENLDAELRGRAEQLGLSVSTIVRNVLLHTFDLVEGVVSDSAQLVRAIEGRETPAARPPTGPEDISSPGQHGAVIGWQEAILNCNGVCDHCNTILVTGERAAVGVPVRPRPVMLCLKCLGALERVGQQASDSPEQEERADLTIGKIGRGKHTDT